MNKSYNKAVIKVKQYASLGKKFYDQKQYKKRSKISKTKPLDCFCKANEDETTVKFTDRDIEVANNNVGLAYAKLGQPLWARSWFMLDENQNLVSLILSNYLHLKHQMTYQVNMSDTQVLVSGTTSR